MKKSVDKEKTAEKDKGTDGGAEGSESRSTDERAPYAHAETMLRMEHAHEIAMLRLKLESQERIAAMHAPCVGGVATAVTGMGRQDPETYGTDAGECGSDGPPELAEKTSDGGDALPDGGERGRFLELQKCDETLRFAWANAKGGGGGMFVHDRLFFHKDTVDGTRVAQLVLLRERRAEGLELAHESLWEGHLECKKTKVRIKGSLYFP